LAQNQQVLIEQQRAYYHGSGNSYNQGYYARKQYQGGSGDYGPPKMKYVPKNRPQEDQQT